MRITILGSGTMASDDKRNPSGYLLRNHQEIALLDCGPGIIKQLKLACIDPVRVNQVFLSHFHLDHCADVFPLLLNRFLLDARSNDSLTIYGPVGTKTCVSTVQGAVVGV